MRHRPRTVGRLLLALVLLGCGGGTEPAGTNVALLSVTLPVSTLLLGTSTTASAKAFDATGVQLSGKSFTWSVLPAGVVSVSAEGSVTAVGAGTAQVVAKTEGVAGSAQIVVVASAQLSPLAGDGQSAVIGAAVATPPSVLVRDPSNNPLAGVPVVFAVTSGGGTVSGATATTSSAGIAQVGSWTLGSSVGTNSLKAAIPNGSSATFTATALPDPRVPVSIVIVAGSGQSGAITDFVGPKDPGVQVLNANGGSIAGATVTFTPSDGGTVSAASVVTDANGVAVVRWRLGPVMGPQSLRAQSGTASANVTGSGLGKLTVAAGNNQTGAINTVVGPNSPAVLVTRPDGTPVQGAPVQFITNGGSATVGAATVLTDAQGLASTPWTLGSSLGTQLLTVLNGSAQVQIAAVAFGPPAQVLVLWQTTPTPLLVGDTVRAAASVRDAIGNPVPTPPIVWSSSDPTVARVSSTGLITALGYGGPVTITATTPDGVSGTRSVGKVINLLVIVPDSMDGNVIVLVDQGPGTPRTDHVGRRLDVGPSGTYRIRVLSYRYPSGGSVQPGGIKENVADVIASGIAENVTLSRSSATQATVTLVRPTYVINVNSIQFYTWSLTDPGQLIEGGPPRLLVGNDSFGTSRCPWPWYGGSPAETGSATKSSATTWTGEAGFMSSTSGRCVQLWAETAAPNTAYHSPRAPTP